MPCVLLIISSCKKDSSDTTPTKGSVSLKYNGQSWFSNEYLSAGSLNNINFYTIPYVPLTIVGFDTITSSSLSISWSKVISPGDTTVLVIDLEDSKKI